MITTVTCTHNPRLSVLEEVLDALLSQEGLPCDEFEILVIDNRSLKPVVSQLASRFSGKVRVVQEDKLGLTHARLRGLREASGDLIVFVDDDNILSVDYLAIVRDRFLQDHTLGALGGRALPVFANEPPNWFSIERYSLGCRDLGEVPLRANWSDDSNTLRVYPRCSPIGGGMAIRKSALAHYANLIATNRRRQALDRTGKSLASGGDNDIVMTVLELGLDVAYEPRLSLNHIIPAGRTSRSYLARYQFDTMVTWVQVLDTHGIRPWSPVARVTLLLRYALAWVRLHAWSSTEAYLRWRTSCGLIKGRASLAERMEA